MIDGLPLLLLVGVAAQWFAAAASIWLTWWAAQSRDGVVWRALAMVLVIVPAMLWPMMTIVLSMDPSGAGSNPAFLFGVLGAGVGVVRALFLGIWSAVSRDRPYLRIGGGVIALLQLIGLAMYGVSGLLG